MIRTIRAVGALLVASILVAGPPVLIVVGLTHWSLPSWSQLLESDPVTPAKAIALAAIPLGGLWLLLSIHLLRRGYRHARAHLSLPRPGRLTAGSVASAVVVGGSAVVVAAPAVTAPPATDAAAQGVDLPDGAGWVPAAVGQAVATTAAALWLRRRRDYRPAAPGEQDLQPLPVTVTAITAATDGGTGPAALLDPGSLPPGGIQLTGPGARDALRGLLITLLLAHRPVVMTWADLGELFDDPYRSGPLPAGLRAVDDLDDLATGEVALTLQAPTTAGTWVCTGPGDAATSWEVAADGTVSRDRRLCVLNPRAAADLFTLLTMAHPAPPAPDPERISGVARLRLLGGWELTVDGRPVPVRRSAGRQVLTYLALHPDGATGHEIIAAIWPGLRPATITGRLHVTISDLRKDLRAGTPVELLQHTNGRYRLTAATDLDVRPWRAAVAALDKAVTAAERHKAQRAIVDAYTGELAAGCDWPWVTAPRERFRRQALTAYLDLAAAAEPAEALELLRAAITVDPHNQQVRARVAELAADRA
ncbi:DNA-binding SARP family transcriptional activator [Actinoplanes octamycinicus]|uniref:DNA-binding SARP family transcriptional activator n=1 Tax=Actinoplanes octamycinicus TaxID=135948 RepID=A0A7W7H4P5_9ACTN|nr:hypothetical protein [Actinoplanes octamycinicus]MBB4743936.1 DNA-binding SARP family transcriptional activator [Actinoplanes octamycinicus]GIE58561.1 hypothetical protein Aoc01nite_39630 [Actinoplanes octamycinicus]